MDYDDADEMKFHDYNEDDEFEEVNHQYSDDGDSSVSTYKKKQRKLWTKMNSTDKDFRKISKKINGKKVEIGLYSSSNTPGSIIKDAIQGSNCGIFRVGSRDEDLFFKVKISTGETGRNGETFFFDSPEQYERHLKEIISQPIKEAWTNKFVIAQKTILQ
jgi:hypothetical protein